MTEAEKHVKPSGNPTTLRILAVVLWVLGIACEVLGILVILQNPMVSTFTASNPMLWIIVALVIDLVLVVIGSLLWKRANKIDPPSEKNQVEFFIKTQLGAIVAVIAFFPILFVLLTNKDMDKKTKTWVSILAAICLLLAVGLSADYNPISLEDLQQMEVNAQSSDFGSGNVEWSKNSKVYHTWMACSARNKILDKNLREGTAKDAFEDGKVRMCRFCANNFSIIDGVEDGGNAADDTGSGDTIADDTEINTTE
jgi:hypothetical protein